MSDYIDEAFDSDDIWKKNGALRKASKEIERLRAANARLVDALAFYASVKNWVGKFIFDNPQVIEHQASAVVLDRGKVARAALAEQEKTG